MSALLCLVDCDAQTIANSTVVIFSLCSLSMPCYLVFHEYICPFRGFTGGQKNEDVKQDKDDVLNIFSVASGHLYERFLR